MPYDKEAIYDEKIAPLMSQIIAIAKEHQIPMAATFQYADTPEEGPGFCTTTIPFPHACEKMHRIIGMMRPERPIALAETHITNPDGSKTIAIRRIT